MANDLALFDPKQMQVPAHLVDDDWGSNTTAPATVPSLLYTGKVWTISANGEKTPLMKRDSDGDEVPLAVFRAIILDFAPTRGRAYYEGNYDPNNVSAPVCWSSDGVAPADAVSDKQSSTCASCQWAKKGSRITEQGKETAACGQHRMLVVVPAHKPDMQPLRLKIAITSDWDKNEELAAQGYFAFQQYNNFLNGRGVNHTAKVVTKMRFDPSVAYPKVIFSPDRWVTAEEAAQFKSKLNSPEVKALLGDSFTPAGADGVATQDEVEVPARPAPAAPKPAAAKPTPSKPVTPRPAPPKPAEALADDDEGDMPLTQAAPVQAAPKPAPAAAKPAAPKPAAKPAQAAPVAAAEVPEDVAAILADWGDE